MLVCGGSRAYLANAAGKVVYRVCDVLDVRTNG